MMLLFLSLIALVGTSMLLEVNSGINAQIDPTLQQQTIDAAVAQRLNATATAEAVVASTATIQAAFEAAVTATAQAQEIAAFEATLVEAAIQTAVADSVRSTEVAFMALTLEALDIQEIIVIFNADWEPVEQVFDGVAMVLVPAGCFQMGSEDGASDERPAHEVCIEAPFWLDKFEVTQADFERLGGVKAEANWFDGDARPVEQIAWFEAEAFCRERRGGRLPSEAEWEFAARGPDGLEYPWRGEFVAENAVYGRSTSQGTADVGEGIRTVGASWVGAHDLSGNVWEWTSSLYRDYPYDRTDGREDLADSGDRILRGGSFFSAANSLRASYRFGITPGGGGDNVGFRCARSPEQSEG
jgi:formylglycine-generating enzyme required for sulfatase activity